MKYTELEKRLTANVDKIVNDIYRADEKELRETLTKVNSYGSTNCGWSSFWAKELFRKFLMEALREKTRVKK